MSQQKGLLVVLSGPSGVGKSTIAHALEQRLGARFSVSMTTRPKSPQEEHGVDYHFVDEARFHRALEEDELLEHARVFEHWYGTPRKPIEQAVQAGAIIVLEIDIEGAIQVRQRHPEAFEIFILPPANEVLIQRLRLRGREGEQAIQRRFKEHEKEIRRARECGVYDRFVVNDDIDQAIDTVISLIEERRTQ